MAGTVSRLAFQKRNPERVNVFLDGIYAFALPAVEAAQLRCGQALSDTEIAQLQGMDRVARAYERALRFLAVRPRSCWEVRRHLQRRRPRAGGEDQLSPPEVDQVVERLQAQGYLDDWAFAVYWVQQRNQFSPRSPQALRYELAQKGIDPTVVDEVVTDGVDAHQSALAAARKQAVRWQSLDHEAFQRKLSGHLQRRGFAWPVIREAVAAAWAELQQE